MGITLIVSCIFTERFRNTSKKWVSLYKMQCTGLHSWELFLSTYSHDKDIDKYFEAAVLTHVQDIALISKKQRIFTHLSQNALRIIILTISPTTADTLTVSYTPFAKSTSSIIQFVSPSNLTFATTSV